MKELKDFTLQEYMKLKDSGLMWEYYPEATGDPNEDLEARNIGVFATNENNSTTGYLYDILDSEVTHYNIEGEELEFHRQKNT